MQNFYFNIKETNQKTKVFGKYQVENSEGGYVFNVSDKDFFDRFLILGIEGGTFYAKEKDVAISAHPRILNYIQSNGIDAVNRIVEVSDKGLAFKNDPAIFCLALATKYGSDEVRALAFASLRKVARTGTHLFTFIEYREKMGGWGRGMRKAVADWYNSQSAESVAFNVMKYKQRNGWSHKDVLRLAHVKPRTPAHDSVFGFVTKGKGCSVGVIPFAVTAATTTDARIVQNMIINHGVSREMINTQLMKDVRVQEALLRKMPIMATVRNLGAFTASGLIKDFSDAAKVVVERLNNEDQIRASRMHPMHFLIALNTYKEGHGEKGSLIWNPSQMVLEALESAFYKSFKYVESTGKNFYFGIDVSSSMSSNIMGTSISSAQGAGVLAMTMARAEKFTVMKGFTSDASVSSWYRKYSKMTDLGITRNDSLDSVLSKVQKSNFGSTDCSLPMLDALENGLDIDTFVVLTDNETYAGDIHPYQALVKYRREMNKPNTKLIVVGMTSNGFTIADPSDAGMLDVVGFTADLPKLVQQFSA